MWARVLIGIVGWMSLAAAAQAARSQESERLFARAVLSEKRGDYWQALRDADAVVRAEPGWPEAQRLRRTAGYAAHYREALRLIDSSDWRNAAAQLENARVYGNTAEISAKLRLVRARLRQKAPEPEPAAPQDDSAIAAAAARWNGYLGSVTQALAMGDWSLADRRIRQLPAAPEPAPPVVHGELLPSLRLYAAGRAGEARVAARALAARPDAAAASLLIFLNSRARGENLPFGLGLMAGVYAAALLFSLYFALRRQLRGSAA